MLEHLDILSFRPNL